MSEVYKVGDQVTVQPIPSDSIILQLSHYVLVSRISAEGYWLRQDAIGREVGPVEGERLLPGWKDPAGRWR